MNLITNAYQALEISGGQVAARVSCVTLENTVAGGYHSLEPGEYVQLLVEDDGPGIPEDIVSTIFEPFFTTKTKDNGTGLGLSVVQGIVQQLNGSIKVSSVSGQGCTFAVHLPVSAAEAIGSGHDVEAGEIRGAERVLLVDDDQEVLRVAQSLLITLGYTVTARVSPLEAIRDFQTNPADFDVVLSDLTMPRLTGIDLAHRLRQIRGDVPIVLMTGFRGAVSAEQLQRTDIQTLLEKPFSRHSIGAAIRGAVDERR